MRTITLTLPDSPAMRKALSYLAEQAEEEEEFNDTANIDGAADRAIAYSRISRAIDAALEE